MGWRKWKSVVGSMFDVFIVPDIQYPVGASSGIYFGVKHRVRFCDTSTMHQLDQI